MFTSLVSLTLLRLYLVSLNNCSIVDALNLIVLELSSSEINTSISSYTFSIFDSSSAFSSLTIFLLLNVKSKFFFEIFDTSIFGLRFSDKKFVITGKLKNIKIIIVLANENFERLFKSLL